MQIEKNQSQNETADRRSLVGLGFESKIQVEMLMIDDSLESLELFSLVTKGLPAHFIPAQNIEEGLEILLEHSFDLIILDWNLDGVPATEFLNAYLQNRKFFQNGDKPFYLATYSISNRDEIEIPAPLKPFHLGHFRKDQSYKKLREKFLRVFKTLVIKEGING